MLVDGAILMLFNAILIDAITMIKSALAEGRSSECSVFDNALNWQCRFMHTSFTHLLICKYNANTETSQKPNNIFKNKTIQKQMLDAFVYVIGNVVPSMWEYNI